MEKLEDMMGFIFKAVKWIVMIGLIFFTVIMYKSCNRTVEVINEPYKETKALTKEETIAKNKEILN